MYNVYYIYMSICTNDLQKSNLQSYLYIVYKDIYILIMLLVLYLNNVTFYVLLGELNEPDSSEVSLQ